MSEPSDKALAERLGRAQWMASGLLASMAVVFAITSFFRTQHPWLDIPWAFSEAALIGGLADWFAVTALFRRPLGLPIPHTAIVPLRKDEIGAALAQFVGENFLIRTAVERRLERTDLASRIGVWLEREHNASLLSRDMGVALDWLLRGLDSAELRKTMRMGLSAMLDKVSIAEALSILLEVVGSRDNTEALIGQLVKFGRDQLELNKSTIRQRIEERSPWWMPKFVDEEIYDQLVAEFERILGEIGEDSNHPARVDFTERLTALRTVLMTDEALKTKADKMRDDFLEHPSVQRFVQDLWERLREYLSASFVNSHSPIRLGIEQEIRHVGSMLNQDSAARARLNHWLREVIVYVVENYRESLSEVISDTIGDWDAGSTARKIELHIGKDLQFIRINGTLVGGFVGVVIYICWRAMDLV